jgi:hypothetical protein
MLRISLRRSIIQNVTERYVSRGALAGGFTQEALHQWAIRHWKDDDVKYVDLFSCKINDQCANWLNDHPYPSSEITRAFFGSYWFLPERILLSSICYPHVRLPKGPIRQGQKFLLWTVVVDSPHEKILEWQIGGTSIGGATMVAFDPTLRKVYHGNCIKFKVGSIGAELHKWYAQRLLHGMVNKLMNVKATV